MQSDRMAVSSSAADFASRERMLLILAVSAVVASFFFMLGGSPLFDVDEGAFSQATLEMFQRGDFLSTYLNGVPRYDKPILIYWLQAASVVLFGVTELAFRLPSAICAALWALATFFFVRRFWGLERAALATAILATSLGVYVIGRAATVDALLNLLITVAMFSAWLHLTTGKRTWLYATHAAIGFGFLAKGPVAILVPLAVTLLFCLLRRDVKTWARAVFDPRALALAIAIGTPWYVAILVRDGWPFFEGFFLKHNVARLTRTLQGHAGSLLYYFPVLVASTLPYTALLVPVFRRLRTIWRDDLQTYLLLWFAFVFVFFSFSGTKLPHYLLYGMTGLLILMAVHADGLKSRYWALAPAALFFIFLLLLPRIAALVLPRLSSLYYRDVLANVNTYVSVGYLAAAAIGAIVVVAAMIERRMLVAHKLAVVGVVMVLVTSAFVMPLAGRLHQSAIVEAAAFCRERGFEPILWRLNAPSFSVYRGRATAIRDPRPGDVVLTRADRLAQLPGYRYEVLYAKNGVVLIRIAT